MTRRFIIRLSSQIKEVMLFKLYLKRIVSQKRMNCSDIIRVYQDGIIVKMMEKDQTFQEN